MLTWIFEILILKSFILFGFELCKSLIVTTSAVEFLIVFHRFVVIFELFSQKIQSLSCKHENANFIKFDDILL